MNLKACVKSQSIYQAPNLSIIMSSFVLIWPPRLCLWSCSAIGWNWLLAHLWIQPPMSNWKVEATLQEPRAPLQYQAPYSYWSLFTTESLTGNLSTIFTNLGAYCLAHDGSCSALVYHTLCVGILTTFGAIFLSIICNLNRKVTIIQTYLVLLSP